MDEERENIHDRRIRNAVDRTKKLLRDMERLSSGDQDG
jgi:hypothetical protein